MTQKLPYRRSAGVALINRDGDVFIGRRKKSREDPELGGFDWQMPQGGIDEGETPLQAARRELYEETNVSSASLIAEAPDWFSYDLPTGFGGRWQGRYRGQRQKWFLFGFDGDEFGNRHRPARRRRSRRRIPGLALGALGSVARADRPVQTRSL